MGEGAQRRAVNFNSSSPGDWDSVRPASHPQLSVAPSVSNQFPKRRFSSAFSLLIKASKIATPTAVAYPVLTTAPSRVVAHTSMNKTSPYSARIAAACLAFMAGLILPSQANAQTVPAPAEPKQDESVKLDKFIVTGSMIKRLDGEGALPLLTITPMEMEERGVVSAEQMIMDLNINGNGLDNLASNADVVSGAQRGNNGATSANLRMQGASATLILLNGRRISSHGLNGGVVDLNSIPFAAIERVEVLKDGASATYGTDAVGGVINFILKKNYQGFAASAAADVTEEGGGNIFRYSGVAGFGDLAKDKFNVMSSLSLADHKRLRGDQRKWNNTFQPNRGLSVDTRGTPVATLVPVSSLYSALSRDNVNTTGRSTGPLDSTGSGVAMSGGINILNLPGGPGFAGTDMQPYDYQLWANPSAKYAAAWDTGRAAVLQQPVKNTNSVTRAIVRRGDRRASESKRSSNVSLSR